MPPTLVDSRRWGGGLSVVWSGWWRPASSPVCQSLEPARCFFCIEETCVSPSYYFSTRILQRIKIYTSWICIGRPLISCEGRGGEGEFAEDPIEGPSSGGFWTGEDISGVLCLGWSVFFLLGTYLKKRKNFFQYVVECFFFRRWQISRIDLYGSIFFFLYRCALCIIGGCVQGRG